MMARLLSLLLIITPPAVCFVTGADAALGLQPPATAKAKAGGRWAAGTTARGRGGRKGGVTDFFKGGAAPTADAAMRAMRGGVAGSMLTTMTMRGGGNDGRVTMGASRSDNDAHYSPPPSSSSRPLLRRRLVRQMVAECMGTFLIVHLGCGTVCSAVYHTAQVGLWQVAAVWSLAVAIAISCTAGISGAHLNPAVSLAMAMFRGGTGGSKNDAADADADAEEEGFGWGKVLPYWAAQLSGAVLGGLLNLALFGESIASFEKSHGIVRGTVDSVTTAKAFGQYWSVSNWRRAFFAEMAGTALLSFVIFSLTNPRNESTGAVPPGAVPALIGGTVGCLISVLAPLTQAGFNPARDLGPRLVSALGGWGWGVAMKGWWVYALAPLVGAPLGAYLAERVLWGDVTN